MKKSKGGAAGDGSDQFGPGVNPNKPPQQAQQNLPPIGSGAKVTGKRADVRGGKRKRTRQAGAVVHKSRKKVSY